MSPQLDSLSYLYFLALFKLFLVFKSSVFRIFTIAATKSYSSQPERHLPMDAESVVNTFVDPLRHENIQDLNPKPTVVDSQIPMSETEIHARTSPEEASDLHLVEGGSTSTFSFPSAQTSFQDGAYDTPLTRNDSGVGLNEKFGAVPVVDDSASEAGKPEVPSDTAPAIKGTRQLPKSNVSALIIDLGDVCCNWTAPEALPISPAMLRRLLKTRTWYEYDSGELSQDECYNCLASQYGASVADVAEAFKQAAQSLSPNEEAFEIIRDLKKTYHDSLKVYLMSNIPLSEWEAVRGDSRYDWTLFDGFFPSGQVGMCKPELRFFTHVLHEVNLKAKDVVFIDDNAENILAARSLGIRCLKYKDVSGLKQFVKLVFENPVERGRGWLQKNAKQMWSETSQGREVRDNFAQLFLYEAGGDL